MRLLNVKTRRLEEFVGDDIPRYAILSHTWGPEEVTFKHIEPEGYKTGSVKIDGCCEQALRTNIGYVWIDTCCIDKSSSAELSEAINSMWSWYYNAAVCYAYLSDVPTGDQHWLDDSAFRESRWFTRGWTLQELLAPDRVEFYDSSWTFISKKEAVIFDEPFLNVLSKITGIPGMFFGTTTGRWPIKSASIAQRMSWAAGRMTTRVEDIAYSLLGIFSVNMTMLYGEGNRAFTRLQEEIMKSSSDESIFAWSSRGAGQFQDSLLASSPSDFTGCGSLVPFTPKGIRSSHYLLTNQGLHIEMSIFESGGTAIGHLNCSSSEAGSSKCVAVPLDRSPEHDNFFTIARECPLVLVSSDLFSESSRAHVYLRRGLSYRKGFLNCGFKIQFLVFDRVLEYKELRLMITEFYPQAWRALTYTEFAREVKPESNRQQILFRVCRPSGLSDFAVLLDCEFQTPEVVPGYNLPRNNSWLQPVDIRYHAALIGKDLALAEVLMTGRKILKWQESLDFGNSELKFDLHKGDARDSIWILYMKLTEK
jgi:hypothetical protein